jgi:hypothetical protein
MEKIIVLPYKVLTIIPWKSSAHVIYNWSHMFQIWSSRTCSGTKLSLCQFVITNSSKGKQQLKIIAYNLNLIFVSVTNPFIIPTRSRCIALLHLSIPVVFLHYQRTIPSSSYLLLISNWHITRTTPGKQIIFFWEKKLPPGDSKSSLLMSCTFIGSFDRAPLKTSTLHPWLASSHVYDCISHVLAVHIVQLFLVGGQR